MTTAAPKPTRNSAFQREAPARFHFFVYARPITPSSSCSFLFVPPHPQPRLVELTEPLRLEITNNALMQIRAARIVPAGSPLYSLTNTKNMHAKNP